MGNLYHYTAGCVTGGRGERVGVRASRVVVRTKRATGRQAQRKRAVRGGKWWHALRGRSSAVEARGEDEESAADGGCQGVHVVSAVGDGDGALRKRRVRRRSIDECEELAVLGAAEGPFGAAEEEHALVGAFLGTFALLGRHVAQTERRVVGVLACPLASQRASQRLSVPACVSARPLASHGHHCFLW